MACSCDAIRMRRAFTKEPGEAHHCDHIEFVRGIASIPLLSLEQLTGPFPVILPGSPGALVIASVSPVDFAIVQRIPKWNCMSPTCSDIHRAYCDHVYSAKKALPDMPSDASDTDLGAWDPSEGVIVDGHDNEEEEQEPTCLSLDRPCFARGLNLG